MGGVLEGEASNYGVMSAGALPFFHALSGCDTTSSIIGKPKRPSMMDGNFFQKLQK